MLQINSAFQRSFLLFLLHYNNISVIILKLLEKIGGEYSESKKMGSKYSR